MKPALISIPLLLLLTVFAYAELNIELLGILEGENDGDRFGHCVANLGDINGDGFEDFGVGAPHYPEWTDTGRVYIYFGGDPLDLEVDMVIDPPTALEFFGDWVCRIDDVNGDGVGEFMVSAIEWFMLGKVFLYFGGEELDDEPDIIFQELDHYYFGARTATGDVNNDGFPDLISAFGGYTDYMYVYLGSAEMDTVWDYILYGYQLGMDGLAIGDVNGDNYDDIVASTRVGRTYVFFGRDSLISDPDVILPSSGQGHGVGDINGDGYDDIIYHYLVYFGGEEPDTLYDLWLRKARCTARVGHLNSDRYGDIVACNYGVSAPSSANIYLGGAEVDTILDWHYVGGYWDNFAYDIDCVDLNADGVDEILISSPNWPDDNRRGRVHVFAGDTTTIGVHEFTEQALPSSVCLSQNYPNPFNSSTVIPFAVSSARPVYTLLEVFDVQGRLVKVLLDRPLVSGVYRVKWDGEDSGGVEVGSGVYFISLKSGTIQETRRIILIK